MGRDTDSYYGSDYLEGSHDNKRTITVAGRIAVVAAVLTAAGAVFLNRDGIVHAAENLFTQPTATATEALPTPSKTKTPEPTPWPIEKKINPTQTATVTSTPTPEKQENKVVKSEFIGGVKLNYDQDGNLVSYQIDNKEVTVSQEAMENARTEAKKNGIGLVTSINVYEEDSTESGKPETIEMPDDIVSKEELEQRGITIRSEGDINLSIRKAAFDEGALLSQYTIGGDKNLTINLVNGPRLSRDGGFDYERIRQEAIQKEKAQFNAYRQGLTSNDSISRQIAEEECASILARIADLTEANNDQLILMTDASQRIGYYDPNNNEIFLATGTNELKIREQIVVFVDAKGKVRTTTVNNLSGRGYRAPSRADSYSRPEDFNWYGEGPMPNEWPDLGEGEARNELYDSYPFAVQTTSQGFRHELTHAYNANNMGNTSVNIDWGNENKTDMEAMGTIYDAYQKWQETGDNSGYYFVFKNNKTGEIILGKDPNVGNQEL
ncbi:MAG TPA: hypothetical protein PK639_04310 [Candidatus Woesebacteria bacterium]|nr:hypothetical protein [Candidatus Woesebacteria bacterium]